MKGKWKVGSIIVEEITRRGNIPVKVASEGQAEALNRVAGLIEEAQRLEKELSEATNGQLHLFDNGAQRGLMEATNKGLFLKEQNIINIDFKQR